MTNFNVLSVFDGMSCAQIALERSKINYKNYYASEIDKYAIKVTQDNYPDTIQVGDITELESSSLPEIHLLVGGSPCQGFSVAGKNLNFNDPRSRLFFDFVRLKNELKPKYFLLENVRMKQESQDVISKYLGVQPIEINSALVSGQLRKRLYWTNIPVKEMPGDKGIKFSSLIDDGYVKTDKAYCLDANYFKKGAEAYRRKQEARSKRSIIYLDEENTRWMNVHECERLQTVPRDYTACVSNTQRYKMLGNGFTVDVIAHIFKGIEND